jgi:glycosyltransferase involved in cell wall biosynthesis
MSLINLQARTHLDVLVRAFDAVRRAIPQARLVLAARGGAEREPVERAVRELGLEDLVRFHRVEPEQLPVLVASGDVVVTIADTDSSPSSLLEAMASGRPIVGGWCPSIDEWIRPGEGAEMVECRDVDAVAAALIKLLGDPDLRRAYGDRNAAVVAERVAESGPALELIYRELIAGRTPPPSRLFDAPATAAT